MKLLQYIANNFKINWKAHLDAPIPKFNEEKVNIFEFNHDKNEPLRDKYTEIIIEDDYLLINWECQNSWAGELTGMKNEIKRWAKYWINCYVHSKTTSLEELIIKIKLHNRAESKKESFTIKIPISN